MTTITIDRAVIEQALEALEAGLDVNPILAGEAEEALRAALAQQDEPVAGRAFLERILAAMEGVIDVADRKTDEFDALRSCVIDLTLMLHTAPPQRKLVPLTEAEIEHIGITHQSLRQVARAVERAVWEKNHG